jgi:hypothetical protein
MSDEKLFLDENGIRLNKIIMKSNIEKDILIEELIQTRNKFENHEKNLSHFKNKAKKHINYLIILMFFTIIFLNEIEFLEGSQSLFVSFIIMFNIAFTKNMLSNVPTVKVVEK